MAFNEIYVIVCNGISDIGKGWLTSALGKLKPEKTLPIKIDPLLNLSFPKQLGVEIERICTPESIKSFIDSRAGKSPSFKISDDFLTYKKVGMSFFPECNIVCGDLINKFLNQPDTQIRPGEIKKRTYSDLSFYLANEIYNISKKSDAERLLIEIGGTIEDVEQTYIPAAIRFLARDELLGVKPKLILLTYFDFAENEDGNGYRIKTQYIRRGIRQIYQYYYGIDLIACFVRRRSVPISIGDEVLLKDLRNVAYETQLAPDRLLLLPNVHSSNIHQITEMIKKRKIL